MDFSLDRLGRMLLSAPFLVSSLAFAFSLLREARDAWTLRAKAAMALTAILVAAIGVGIAVMILSDDDFVWCTEDNRDDGRCKHWG